MAWLIQQIDPKPSIMRSGSICYHIQLQNVTTHRSAKTYVESTFYNYQNWREIVENSHLSFIVSSINEKAGIVNADSKPTVEIAVDPETMNRELAQHKQQSTTFGDLFE